jgi:hypothetical protein
MPRLVVTAAAALAESQSDHHDETDTRPDNAKEPQNAPAIAPRSLALVGVSEAHLAVTTGEVVPGGMGTATPAGRDPRLVRHELTASHIGAR